MIESSFQTPGVATEKVRLPKLRFALGTIRFCEMDALSCLGIFEICRGLPKKDGCCVGRARYVRVESLILSR